MSEEDGLGLVESLLREDPDDERIISLCRTVLGELALSAFDIEQHEVEIMQRRGLLIAAATGGVADASLNSAALDEVAGELDGMGMTEDMAPLFQEIARVAADRGHLYVSGVAASLAEDAGGALHSVAAAVLSFNEE